MKNWFFLLTSVVLTLGFCRTSPAQAQIFRPGAVAVEAGGITAHGHAEIKARPDEAMLTVSVTTQGQNPTTTAQDNATRTTAVLEALRKANIASKDIQTQNYSVQPQYSYNTGQTPTLTGFQVENIIQVTVHDLTQIGTVIDQATQAGATQVNGPNYELSDRSAVENQALGQAAANAHQKAAAMAGAVGVGLGPLLTLTDGQAPTVQPMYAMPMMARSAAAAGQPTTPISEQQLTITADVTAVYQVGAITP